MFSQDRKKIGIETGEETQFQGSQLSQIYLEQWKKENFKPKIEKKKQMNTVREPLEDKKCNENKGLGLKRRVKRLLRRGKMSWFSSKRRMKKLRRRGKSEVLKIW